MSEAYQQKEWELNALIDDLSSIEYTYEEYKKEVDHFIDRLLEDAEKINTYKFSIKIKDKQIEELIDKLEKQRHFYLDQLQQKENIIKEVREYIEENTKSDSSIELTSGKITDIGYCIVAFEDILEILDKAGVDKE